MNNIINYLTSTNILDDTYLFNYICNTTFSIKVSNKNIIQLNNLENNITNHIIFENINTYLNKIYFNSKFIKKTIFTIEFYDENSNIISTSKYNFETKESYNDKMCKFIEENDLFIISFINNINKTKLIIKDDNFKNNKYYIFLNVNYKNEIKNNRYCEICDMSCDTFKDYKSSQYKSICTYCQSVYKHRCFAHVLKNMNFKNKKVLLLSPRTCDLIFFQNKNNFDYDIMDICKKQDDNRPDPNIVADICDTNDKIKDNTYDIISCIATISVVSDYDNAIKELHRILKKNGTVYIVDELFDENVEPNRKEETIVVKNAITNDDDRSSAQIRRTYHVSTIIDKYRKLFNKCEVKYGETLKFDNKNNINGVYKYIILCLIK